MSSMELKQLLCVQPHRRAVPSCSFLSWLGSVCDTEETLRNLEGTEAIIKSECGSLANAAFPGLFNDFGNRMSFLQSGYSNFYISCFDDLCQHFLVLKSHKSAKADCALVFNKCLSQEFKIIYYKKYKEGKSISLLLRPEITKPRNFFQPY